MLKSHDMEDYIEYEIPGNEVMQVIHRQQGGHLLRFYDKNRTKRLELRETTLSGLDYVISRFEEGTLRGPWLDEHTQPYKSLAV